MGTGLTTAQILRVFSEEQSLYITAFLKGLREEFIISHQSLTLTSNSVDCPVRAAGGAFRTVQYRGPGSGSRITQLPRVEPENVPYFQNNGSGPGGYVFIGNEIQMVPNSVNSGTLDLAYQQRLGTLVLSNTCAEIIDFPGANAVTVSAVPSSFSVLDTNGQNFEYDLISGQPNFQTRAIDQTIVSIVGSVITLTDDLPDSLQIGDWMAFATQTPIPQLPTEVHYLLAQRGASVLADAFGSSRKDAIAAALNQARTDATMLLSARSDGSARPIISRYGAGNGGIWGGWF